MTPSGDEYELESSDESESVFSTTPPQASPSPLAAGYKRYLLRGCIGKNKVDYLILFLRSPE